MTRRIDNLFWNAFALLLLGYAVIGRGVAYIGVSPIFVGELVLILGGLAVCSNMRRIQIPRSPALWVLVLLVLWCFARTVPFIEKYGTDALRDSAIWGYGAYAIVLSTLLAHDPERLPQLLNRFKKFAWALVLIAPVILVAQKAFKGSLPSLPGTDANILSLKGGDVCVHLAGVFAFLTLFTPVSYATPLVLLMPLTLALNMLVRAGLLTFALGTVLLTLLRPRNPLLARLGVACVLGVGAMWAFDIRFRPDPDSSREVSTDQLINNILSTIGQSNKEGLDGTKEWRMRWWKDIIEYTVHGPYFWTGKGFGVNLATDDGFQVEQEETLRSPHNAHMTILARTGVPGLMLWVGLQMAWAATLFFAYIRATRAGDRKWANLFVVLLVYWLAFLTNASFDVFLEGPMGGIWYWSLMGIGVGATKVYQRAPQVLEQYEDPSGAQLLSAGRWRGRSVRVGTPAARTARA